MASCWNTLIQSSYKSLAHGRCQTPSYEPRHLPWNSSNWKMAQKNHLDQENLPVLHITHIYNFVKAQQWQWITWQNGKKQSIHILEYILAIFGEFGDSLWGRVPSRPSPKNKASAQKVPNNIPKSRRWRSGHLNLLPGPEMLFQTCLCNIHELKQTCHRRKKTHTKNPLTVFSNCSTQANDRQRNFQEKNSDTRVMDDFQSLSAFRQKKKTKKKTSISKTFFSELTWNHRDDNHHYYLSRELPKVKPPK